MYKVRSWLCGRTAHSATHEWGVTPGCGVTPPEVTLPEMGDAHPETGAVTPAEILGLLYPQRFGGYTPGDLGLQPQRFGVVTPPEIWDYTLCGL